MQVLMRTVLFCLAIAAPGWMVTVPSGALLGAQERSAAAGADLCAAPANKIVAENCRPGNPREEWDISDDGDPGIQGFATEMSVTEIAKQLHVSVHTVRKQVATLREKFQAPTRAELVRKAGVYGSIL